MIVLYVLCIIALLMAHGVWITGWSAEYREESGKYNSAKAAPSKENWDAQVKEEKKKYGYQITSDPDLWQESAPKHARRALHCRKRLYQTPIAIPVLLVWAVKGVLEWHHEHRKSLAKMMEDAK